MILAQYEQKIIRKKLENVSNVVERSKVSQ